MIKGNDSPVLYGDLAKTAQETTFDGLKGINTAFNGYSIAEGEVVVFPTNAEIEQFGKKLFKKGKIRATSNNVTALVRVERINNGTRRQSWFNLGTLTRNANQADGTRMPIDELHANMAQCTDAHEVMENLIGKAIMGTGKIDAYGPKFNAQTREIVRDENNRIEYEPRAYVTVDFCDVPEAE